MEVYIDLTFVRSMTSTIFAPAIADISITFRSTDQYISSFSLTDYLLGHATSSLFIPPLSEITGCYMLYKICNAIFTICTWRCASTSSFLVLSIWRFFAGVGGGAVFALAPSSIADLLSDDKRGTFMALITLAYMVGPAVGPVVGSYLDATWGWKWIFNIAAIAGGIINDSWALLFAGDE